MTRTRRAAWGVVSSYAGAVVTAVAGFLVVPLVLRSVSRADYGLWVAVGQAVGYLALLDLGVGSAVVRRTAELSGQPDGDVVSGRTVSTAIALYCALGVVFVAVGAAIAPLLPHLLSIPDERTHVAKTLFLLMVVYGGMALPMRVALKALYGRQQMARANLVTLAENLLSPLTAAALLAVGVGLLSLPIGSLAAGTIAAAAGIVLLRRAAPGLGLTWRNVRRSEARELFAWSWLLWVNSFAVLVIYQTDNLVVASRLGLVAATVYALTSRLPFYAMPVIFALSDACLPGVVELSTRGSVDRVRAVYVRVLRITAAAAAAAGIIAIGFNAAFMQLWVGSQNFGGTLLSLAFGIVLYYRVLLQTSAIVVIGSGRIRGVVAMSVVEAALNLVLSLWWVRRYGLVGVAAGTVVAGLLTSAWYVPVVVCRAVALRGADYVRRAVLVPWLCGIPAGALAWVINRNGLASTWVQLAIAVCAVGAVYAATFAAFGISGDERGEVYGRIAGFARAARGAAASIAARPSAT